MFDAHRAAFLAPTAGRAAPDDVLGRDVVDHVGILQPGGVVLAVIQRRGAFTEFVQCDIPAFTAGVRIVCACRVLLRPTGEL